MHHKITTHVAIVLTGILTAGCTTAPLAERTLGEKFAIAKPAMGPELSEISFSADHKYETEKGVPLRGDPLICRHDGIFRINDEHARIDRIAVKSGDEIAVTSVIQWTNTGWMKTCWPFVAFIPQSGQRYTVVNERIGGKGASMLWTGVGLQTCQVSVYRETPTGFERVESRQSSVTSCRSAE